MSLNHETSYVIPEAMRVLYVARRKAEAIKCANAIDNQDFSFLETIGHQIKGNAESFGFSFLAPMAQALEEAAKCKDVPQLKLILKDLGIAVERLSI